MMRSWHPLILSCISVSLLAGRLRAGDDFQVFAQTRSIPELGRTTNWVIATDRNRFSFVPPGGWAIQTSPDEKKIVLLPPDRNGNIAISVVETNTTPASNHGRPRERVARKYPQARVVRESDCYTASGLAKVLDCQIEFNEGRATSALRVVFLDCPAAEVEFSVTAPAPALDRNQRALSSLLNNFRVEPAPVAAPASQAKEPSQPSSLSE
ncbi:MAG TPA: hypothetical protein VJW76_03110 [Verrucomicrobiae bacterium]|nr:hypothetical protein [Verrucomicrobiae bacterium]